ncbi:MAG: hypothetical protein LBG90_08335 [Spirochaetaceae bacterium]|nr:hypothetical protein [Spirochaetaceae bacterium]
MAIFVYACAKESGEIMIIPPPTHPLSRSVVGYGVIKASFTRVMHSPEPAGVSLGYLRRGAVVRVLERRSLGSPGRRESWVLVEGNFRGWLQEDEQVIDIYDLEAQAGTAASIITR